MKPGAIAAALASVVIGLPVFGLIGRAIWIARHVTRVRAVHEDARGSGAPAGAQLVGEKCATCKRSIIAEREAMACPRCSAPVHRDRCHAKHDATDHA